MAFDPLAVREQLAEKSINSDYSTFRSAGAVLAVVGIVLFVMALLGDNHHRAWHAFQVGTGCTGLGSARMPARDHLRSQDRGCQVLGIDHPALAGQRGVHSGFAHRSRADPDGGLRRHLRQHDGGTRRAVARQAAVALAQLDGHAHDRRPGCALFRRLQARHQRHAAGPGPREGEGQRFPPGPVRPDARGI